MAVAVRAPGPKRWTSISLTVWTLLSLYLAATVKPITTIPKAMERL